MLHFTLDQQRIKFMNKYNKQYKRIDGWTSKEFIALQTIRRLLVILIARWKQRKSKQSAPQARRLKPSRTILKTLRQDSITFNDVGGFMSQENRQSNSQLGSKDVLGSHKSEVEVNKPFRGNLTSNVFMKSDELSGMRSSEEHMQNQLSTEKIAPVVMPPPPRLFSKPDFQRVILEEHHLESLSMTPKAAQKSQPEAQLLKSIEIRPSPHKQVQVQVKPQTQTGNDPKTPEARPPHLESPSASWKRPYRIELEEEQDEWPTDLKREPRSVTQPPPAYNQHRRSRSAAKKYVEVGVVPKSAVISKSDFDHNGRQRSPKRVSPLEQIEEEQEAPELPEYPDKLILKRSGSKITMPANFVPSNTIQSQSYHELAASKQTAVSQGSSSNPRSRRPPARISHREPKQPKYRYVF